LGDAHPAAGSLAQVLPREVPGTVVRDLPLGPTEYIEVQTLEKMEYDDVLHRSYQTARGAFTIYAGYWRAGRVSPGHVASHLPDRCWTLAGMTCTSLAPGRSVHPALPPGNGRRFRSPEGQEIETVFWHLVGKDNVDYGANLRSQTSPTNRIWTVITELFTNRGEQIFVRISSNEGLERFAADPAFDRVAASLNRLGLKAETFR
jgi:hypothetical protein